MQRTTSSKMLWITAKEAKELKKVQVVGRQDPYLELWVGRGGTKVKTSVHDDGASRASWDATFKFDPPEDPAEYLYFEVRNKNITNSTPIGMGKVLLKTFGEATTSAWHPIFDKKGKPAGQVLLEAWVRERETGDRAMGVTGQNFSRISTQGAPLSGGGSSVSLHGGGQASAGFASQGHALQAQQDSYGEGYGSSRGATLSGNAHHSAKSSSVYSLPGGYGNTSHNTAPSATYQHRRHETYSDGSSIGIPSSHNFYRTPHSPPVPINPTTYHDNRDIINGGSSTSTRSATKRNAVYYTDPASPSRYGGTPASARPYGFTAEGEGVGTAAVRTTLGFADGSGSRAAAVIAGSFRGISCRGSHSLSTIPWGSGMFFKGSPPIASDAHNTEAYSSLAAPTAPRAPSAPPANTAYSRFAPLPFGWEENVTPDGRTYYMDHATKTTTWVRPV